MTINDIVEIINNEMFNRKPEYNLSDIGQIPIYLITDTGKQKLECNGLWVDIDGKCILVSSKEC